MQKNSENVLFIDASKDFVKQSAQNNMTEEQISRVVSTYLNRNEIDKYSHIASYSEIEENDYNLNIPRYVDSFIPEPLPDATEILENLKTIDEEEQMVKTELYKMLSNLVGNDEDMKIVQDHKRIIKPNKIKNNYEQMRLNFET